MCGERSLHRHQVKVLIKRLDAVIAEFNNGGDEPTHYVAWFILLEELEKIKKTPGYTDTTGGGVW